MKRRTQCRHLELQCQRPSRPWKIEFFLKSSAFALLQPHLKHQASLASVNIGGSPSRTSVATIQSTANGCFSQLSNLMRRPTFRPSLRSFRAEAQMLNRDRYGDRISLMQQRLQHQAGAVIEPCQQKTQASSVSASIEASPSRKYVGTNRSIANGCCSQLRRPTLHLTFRPSLHSLRLEVQMPKQDQ